MKCPKCGQELTISKKDPTYALCYQCRKKYKLPEKYYKEEEADEEETEEFYSDDYDDDGNSSYYEDDDNDYDDDEDDGYYEDDEDDDDDYYGGNRRGSSGNRGKSGPPSGRGRRKKKKNHGFLKVLLILVLILIILCAAVLGLYKFELLPDAVLNKMDTFVTEHLSFLSNDKRDVLSNDASDDGDDGTDAEGNATMSASFQDFLQYMQASGTVAGEPSDTYPEVIGALNGCKYIDSNVEFYEFDMTSDRYAEASESSQIGAMEVAAVNGPFVLIFDTEEQSADILNAFMSYTVQ